MNRVILSKSLVYTIILWSSIMTVSGQVTQKIGGNPGTIDPKAVLELESTTKGFLLPRMTAVQVAAITNPTSGMIVFCTDCGVGSDGELRISYNGVWQSFKGNLTGNITGNAATVTTNANLTGAITSNGNATSLGSFTSSNLATAITDETGTGSVVLSNSPTFTGTVTAPIYASTPQPLTDAATISWNPTNGLNASVTLGGNRTLSFTSTPAIGSYGTLVVTQDATGNRTITLPTSLTNKVLGLASTATTIDLSTAANAKDILNFYYDGTYCYWNVGQGYGTEEAPLITNLATNVSGTLAVANGGTGTATLTGYVKGNGTSAMTANPTIPVADVTGAAPLASPTFTGTPTLPTGTIGVTQSAGNNTTALATTAFVTAANSTNANLTGPITSSGNTTSVASQTGTGSTFVMNTSPTLVTPVLGAATATSINSTTIPTSKTLVVTTDKLNVMSSTSSTELAGVISDETGTGSVVLSNSPTFTGSVTSPVYASTPQALTYGSTINWNPTNGLNASVLLGGNGTLSFTSTPAIGSYGTLVVTQDATGNRTITLPGTANKVLGSASTTTIALSTAANAKDILNFYYDGTNYYWNVGQGYGTAAPAVITNMATNVSGTLAVANGGTGATTLTGLVKGNGAGAMTAAVAGTDYVAPSGNITGNAATVTTNANLTGPITSSGNTTSVASQTGTGSTFVMNTSPTLVTPVLGAATATSINSTTIPTSKTLVVTTDKLNVMAATSSSELAGVISDETGTGSLVLSASPTLTGDAKAVTAIAGDNDVSIATTEFVTSAITSANATNANLSGAVTSVGNTTSLGSFTSANLASALSDETGTGAAVLATSPTLVTPVLGAATGTSLSVTGQLTSTVATGTAPLVVTSTTPVANLNIGGNAATVTTNANLTGVVTSTGNATAIADGALSIAKTSGLQTAIDAKVADAINDGTTTIAPSQNAVFDALALKANLASPTFTGTVTAPIYASSPQALTYGSTITWNPASGLNAKVTLTGNGTLSFSSTPTTGSFGTLVVTQDGTGNRTITLPGTANKVLGSASNTTIALSTAANATDILNFYYDGSNYFWNVGQGYGTAAPAVITNLATNVSGTLPVGNGGTGATTLTGLVKGNGTGAMTAAVAGTDYVAPSGNITGNAATVTTNANLSGAVTSVGNTTSLGSFTSANLASALSDETGSGVAVLATSPTLVTPVLGAATGTSLSVTGQLTSTVATGTAPLVVTSTTPVANLNIGGNAATATSATTATNANNTAITDDATTATAVYPTFVTANTGNLPQKVTSTKLSFVPSTGALSATSFVGSGAALTGVVATTNANLTGAVTSTGNATSLGSFTSANLASALSDETGSGVAVLATSPTLVTPVLGAATGTSLSVTGQLTSTVATGTAPLVVTSTTPVANLNIGGNAATATATGITDDATISTAVYPTFVGGTSGNQAQKVTSTKLSFVPSTGALTATSFAGSGSGLTGTATSLSIGGNAATVTTNANLTGVVTSLGNTTAIAAGVITNAMLENSAVANLSGTNSGDNAVNSLYSGLISNATHTGDVTGSTTLTLATVNTNTGSFGSATSVPTLTVNAKGLVTAASATAIPTATSTTAGLLTSTDWNTFNNKQGVISLTTTGNSGASSFTSNTLNIPTYTLSGLGGQPLATNLTSIGGLANASGVLVNNGTGTFSYSTTPTLTGTNFTGVPYSALTGTVPTWNQSTTGTAANVTGTVAISNGGTGSSTQNFVDLSSTQTVAGNKTFSNTITANTIVKTGGTSAQFLMADGSVSSGTPLLTEADIEITATAGQTSFALTQTPSTLSKVKMYVNGIRISKTAYTISGSTLTYIPANNENYTITLGDRVQFEFAY